MFTLARRYCRPLPWRARRVFLAVCDPAEEPNWREPQDGSVKAVSASAASALRSRQYLRAFLVALRQIQEGPKLHRTVLSRSGPELCRRLHCPQMAVEKAVQLSQPSSSQSGTVGAMKVGTVQPRVGPARGQD